jgi:hypothetical protein
MKHLSLCIIIAISLLACNNKKKAAIPEAATPAEVAETRSELDKEMDKLQQLAPYTIEQMRALLPTELDGDSTRQVEALNSLGTNFAAATYKLSDTTFVEVAVFDCGGVAGAGVYNSQFVNEISEQWEGANGYKRLVDFNGGKAIEQVNLSKKTCSLTYMDNDRFLVTINGENTDITELKDKADDLKLK